MKIDFPCGDEIYKLRLNVPEKNVQVIKSKNTSAKMNIKDQTREALTNPIRSKKLCKNNLKGKRVVILVDDISRSTPADKIVPIVLERLKKAGADDITFIIARGAHMPGAHYLHEYMSTPSESILKEQISKLGDEIVENFRVITHDGFNPDNVRYVGVSSNGTPIWINEEVLKADFKMAIGRVCPHLDVGYAGGAKMILPGVSGIETVFVNHLKFNTRFGYGTLYENPARRDIEEVGNIVGLDFILNFALWMGHSRKAFAGDMNDAHKTGIEWGDRYVWGAEIGEKGDITIVSTSSDGQGLEYARRCSTKRGGTIIYVSPEEEDVVIEKGNYVQELASIKAEYAKKMQLMDLGDLIRKEARYDFPDEIYHAHMNYTCRRAKLHYYQHHIIHVGGKLSENIIVYGEEMKREPMDHMESIDDAISQAIKEQGNNAKIIVIPEGDKTLPIYKIHEREDFYNSSIYNSLSNWEFWGGRPTYP